MQYHKLLAALAIGAGLLCSTQAMSADFGADRHVARGIQCASCHGKNNEVAYPSIEQCTTCHNPEQVAERTKGVKPQNPHVSPHYGKTLDCALCHLQHAKPENYCDQCHQFGFKVR